MDTHSGAFWLILKVVVVLTAAMALFDIVNLARKARGQALLWPRFFASRSPSPRSLCLIALAATLGVATVVQVIARGI